MRASTVGELSRQSGPVKGGSRPESPPNPECFMALAPGSHRSAAPQRLIKQALKFSKIFAGVRF